MTNASTEQHPTDARDVLVKLLAVVRRHSEPQQTSLDLTSWSRGIRYTFVAAMIRQHGWSVHGSLTSITSVVANPVCSSRLTQPGTV
jgi:hypothetical protein